MARIPRSEIFARLQAMKAQGKPHVLILVHGGPIAEPADAEYVFAHSRYCDGFYGASFASFMERLPVERALSAQVQKFKSIKKGQKNEKNTRASARR